MGENERNFHFHSFPSKLIIYSLPSIQTNCQEVGGQGGGNYSPPKENLQGGHKTQNPFADIIFSTPFVCILAPSVSKSNGTPLFCFPLISPCVFWQPKLDWSSHAISFVTVHLQGSDYKGTCTLELQNIYTLFLVKCPILFKSAIILSWQYLLVLNIIRRQNRRGLYNQTNVADLKKSCKSSLLTITNTKKRRMVLHINRNLM